MFARVVDELLRRLEAKEDWQVLPRLERVGKEVEVDVVVEGIIS